VHDEEFKWLVVDFILDFDGGRELTLKSVLIYLVNLIFSKLLR
jgi:hypothetical protein